ncbi:hypothetical protein SteCoe_35008 [Stentor coeruleus]|uniref:USP domain-containing protein n=1 Tax=Stentor coeruleus TaxID=5963 RepID=A0A1R2AT99_9CILI|nr:hypothetical protein SteCoe_35008 [Stentor coeruleus]
MNDFQIKIKLHDDNNLGIRDNFFYQIDLKDAENLKKLKSPNIIEDLFDELCDLTKVANCSWNPIDHVFKLSKMFLIEGNQCKKLINSSNYILNAEISNDLVHSNKKLVISKRWPLTLCLDSKIINFNETDHQEIHLHEKKTECKVVYTLKMILIERNDDILIYIKNTQNIWICINYSRVEINFNEAFNMPIDQSKYLFYERKSFPNKKTEYQNFVNMIWMNFYLIDSIYLEFIKIGNPETLFIKETINNFHENEKNRNQIIVSKGQESNFKGVKPDEKFFEKPSDLENLTELFFNYSDFAYKFEYLNNLEVFKCFIEEVHFKKGLENLCNCPLCKQLVHKIYENSHSKKDFIISLDDQDIFTYVSKFSNSFSDTILNNVDLNKFKNPNEASYFMKYMTLKLLASNEKCKFEFNEILIYHMKSSKMPNRYFLIDIMKLSFEEPKNELYYYHLESILFVYDDNNCCLIITTSENKWNTITSDNSEDEKIFKNLSDALMKLNYNTQHFDIFLFYRKQSKPSQIDNLNPEGSKGTQPLRCDNSIERNLCYINSAIQCLFNIYSFKIDVSKWMPEKNNGWKRELIEMFKAEFRENKQGKKIYNLKTFRKFFIEETKYSENKDCQSNSMNFLKHLLENIHKDSNCNSNKKCLACENFGIKRKDKDDVQFQLFSHIKEKGIKLTGNILNVHNNKQINVDLPNPPWCLLYYLKANGDLSTKAEILKDFMVRNKSIDYVNEGKTYHYELKSVILYGGSHFKSLLYSRTYKLWMLMNDSDIEPLYLELEDYQSKENSFLPEGLIYYRVLPDETIKKFISTLYISLCTTQAFISAYKVTDTKTNILKDTFSFLKEFSEKIHENLKVQEFSHQYIISFKQKGEIRNIQNSFSSFLKIFHSNEKNDSLKCKCPACKIFCCQIIEKNEGFKKIKRKLGVSVDIENVLLQYNIIENKFDCNSFVSNSSKSLSVMKAPPLLGIQLKSSDNNSNIYEFYNLLNENRILYINEPLSVYFLHSIIFSCPSNSNTLAYIETSTRGTAYEQLENRCIILNSITLKDIFDKGYYPIITFYEKQNINYITTSIKTLNHLTTFKEAINNHKINEEWFQLFKNLLSNNEIIKNSRAVWAFKDAFNQNTEDKISDLALKNYNIEQTIKLIFNRIHIESNCIDNSCPVCLNFLIEGTCKREDCDESHALFVTRLNNSFGPKMNKFIGENVLSYIYDKKQISIIYDLVKLPKILYYICLYDIIHNEQESEIKKICKNSLRDKITIVCTKDQTPRNYILKCIIFSIKNGCDIYKVAVKDRDNAWRFDGSDKTVKTAPEIIDEAEEFFGRLDFYPSELFYELC